MEDGQLRLLVRVDAGPNIGTGHVMRMIALAQGWKQLHGQTTFVCGDLPRGLVDRIVREGFQIYQIADANGDKNDARQTLEIANVCQPDWIVLDGYHFDDAYQRVLARAPAQLMVLDDFGHATHQHADLVLNQNRHARPESIHKQMNQTRFLTGPRYALLRREFSDFERLEEKHIFNNARRILVSFGGADPDNWTLRTLQALSDLNRPRLIVDCVVGACFLHLEQLAALKKTANMHLRIHRNVDRMDTLMEFVDLAISAGGSTCYELARFGVPSVVIPISNNQHVVTASMVQAGAMVTLEGLHDQIKRIPSTVDSEMRKTLRKLMNNRNQREQMSRNGQKIVDGRGANRIALQLAGSCYSLRSASQADAELILNWRNDPEVRAVSFNEQRIAASNHHSWLRKKLADKNCQIWIAENRFGQPIGKVRCDIDATGSATTSVIVDQAHRGRGVGTVLIQLALETVFDQQLAHQVITQIRPFNAASERAFRKAGFQPIAPTTISGKLASQFVFKKEWLTEPQFQSTAPLKKSA